MNHLHCHLYSCDEDYIRDIRAGGSRAENAISCLYLRHRQQTHRYLARMIRKHPDYKGVPEDLVHDAFIIMVDKIRFDQIHVQSLGGFWIGIARYLMANQLRRDARIVLIHDPEHIYNSLFDESTTWVMHDMEEKDWMDRAFHRLEARCRDILIQWMEGYTMHEIARKMGLANDAMARKLKYHCFKKLKEILRDGYIPEG